MSRAATGRAAAAHRMCGRMRTVDLSGDPHQAERLHSVTADDTDAVVLLDVIADTAAVDELQRLACSGVRLVLAAPCDALEALAAAAPVRVLPREALVTVGFVPDGTTEHASLVAANEELRRANVRLAKRWLARSDSAAASIQHRLDVHRESLRALEAEVRDRDARIAELTARLAAAELRYEQEHEARVAPRYRAVDAVRDAILAVPGLSLVMRGLWRLVAPRR